MSEETEAYFKGRKDGLMMGKYQQPDKSRLLTKKEISKALDSRLGTEHERFVYVAEAQDTKTASIVRREMVEEIDRQIELIDKDERYHYQPAQVQINAPLALIQCGMESRMALLRELKRKWGVK